MEPTGVAGDEVPVRVGAAVPGGGILPRTRLVDGLLGARLARVVVLEAPAGYSKTTTLRLWNEADPRDFAWASCDSRHDDPALLIETIVNAIDRFEEIDPEVLMSLSSPSPDLNLVLGRLEKAMAALRPFVLVIDDAHLIRSDDSWQVIYSVAASMPEYGQVAIGTRTRPGLPLGRLRARGELHELTMSDLALTRRESRELLAGLDLELGARADEIHERAEGWPAALYLAGLAIRQDGRATPEAARFDGGDRVLVEYFQDEFLQGLPEEKAQFMYRTSILDELSGPACDAVTGRHDSALLLEELARENALVVPLGRSGTRYRYHHLFADMLRLELTRREPEAEPELHHRAAAWLAGNGEIPRATDHAIASGDLEFAGALIWLDIADITGRGRIATVDRWFDAIGNDAIARVPALILARAHREMVMGRGDESHYWLSVAEREIDVDSPCFGDLLMVRATMGPDGPAAMVADATRAAELLDLTNPWHVPVTLYRGVGLFLQEDPEAEEILRVAAREAVGVSPVIQNLALAHLALSELESGRVDEAFTHIARARDQVDRCGLGLLGAMSMVFAVLADVLVRRGRQEEADEAIARCVRMSAGMADFIGWYESELLLISSRVLLRSGKFESAAGLADQAEGIIDRTFEAPRLVRWLAEIRAALARPSADGLNLTKAELRALAFLPSHHSFRAIGEQLHLSQNTVKTQANSLYRKLGVNSRAEAVMEGRRLGILDEESS